MQADRGYQIENVLVADISLFGEGYAAGASRVQFYRELVSRVAVAKRRSWLLDRAQKARDDGGDALPVPGLGRQLPPARRGDGVVARAPIVL